MMKILCYRDGQLLEKMTAERLDVCSNSLNIYGMKRDSEPHQKDYFYFGVITFQMVKDTLRIDLFEPDEAGGPEHHIRLTAFDW